MSTLSKKSFFIIVLLMLGMATPAGAEKFLIAQEKDKNIRALLAELLPVAEKQLERYDSDVARVYHQRIYKAQEESYDTYENFIWWVKRGEAEEFTNFVKDFRPGEEVKKVKAFFIRPGSFDQEAVLAGEIQELDGKRIHIQKGDKKQRITNLVVGFETAQPGDLLCISVHSKVEVPLQWKPWLVAQKEPLARGELRVKCDWRLAFSVFGYRFAKGKMQQEILDKDKHHIKDLRVWADDIEPLFDEPYSPPAYRQSPVLAVAWRGSRFPFFDKQLWWYYQHWNQVAADMSGFEKRTLKEAEEVGRVAQGLKVENDEKATAEALWDFVHEELLELGSWAYLKSDNTPTVDEILEARSGSTDERCFLFLAMLRSCGIDARVVWAHDPMDGGFLDEYPIWEQVPVPLVKVVFSDQEEWWYDLGCSYCPAGDIRPRMRHTRALVYDPHCYDVNSDLIEDVFVEGAAYGRNPFLLYLDDLKMENWKTLVFTPGNPAANSGWQKESLELGLSGEGEPAGTLMFESWGLTELSESIESEGDVISSAEHLAKERFDHLPEILDSEENTVATDTLRVVLNLKASPLPEPMGNTWILPADLVFGNPTQEPWPEKRRSRFHIYRSLQKIWECRIDLPEGWTRVKIPEVQYMGIDLLRYRLAILVQDGQLVVKRSLIQHTGDVDDPRILKHIGQEIEKIRLVESSPLVLKKLDD